MEVRVGIFGIKVDILRGYRYMVLREVGAERLLVFPIGTAEADSIVLKLAGKELPRPLTHDLAVDIISKFGATITRVVIHKWENEILFARILVEDKESHLELDSRPSDAIALAVRTNAPIFVEESILQAFNQRLRGENPTNQLPSPPAAKISEEALGPFADAIKNINWDEGK